MLFSGSFKTFIIFGLLRIYCMADEKDDYDDNYNYPEYDQDDGAEREENFYHKIHKPQAWDQTDYDAEEDSFENLQQPQSEIEELLDSPDFQLSQSYLTKDNENGSLKQEEQQMKFLQKTEDYDTTTDIVLKNQQSQIEEQEYNDFGEEDDLSTRVTFEESGSEEQVYEDFEDEDGPTMAIFFKDYQTLNGKKQKHDNESVEQEDFNFEAEQKTKSKGNEKEHIKSEVEQERETSREYLGHQFKKQEYNNSADEDRPTIISYQDYLQPPIKEEKLLLAIFPVEQPYLQVHQQPQASGEGKYNSDKDAQTTNESLRNPLIDRQDYDSEQQDKLNLEIDNPEYSDYEEVEESRTEDPQGNLQLQVKERKDYDFDSNEAEDEEEDKQLMHLIWGPSFIMLPNGRDYVQGKQYQTALTGRYYQAFLGLQYGTIEQRIENFQPIGNGSKITVAISEPTGCPSLANLLKINNSRFNVNDCLTLSVFTPKVVGSLPVLIYIHGEMLFDGSSESAGPEHLLENDVVLVVVKYRLASFGFYEVSENLALSDLELATIWVMDNIASFGGDPKSISLFGGPGSAGLVYALDRSLKVETRFLELLNNA